MLGSGGCVRVREKKTHFSQAILLVFKSLCLSLTNVVQDDEVNRWFANGLSVAKHNGERQLGMANI